MNTETKIMTANDIVATFEGRIAAIEARNIPVGTYILRWDNGLCVGLSDSKREGWATGFEHCAFFGDREAAAAWQRRYRIRNGKGEMPSPVLAFNARQGAVVELEGHINTIRELTPKEA